MPIRIKNWSKHQHFKDRTPPWIKLYRDILDDPDWHDLSGESAKLLVSLWLIASEDETHQGALPGARKLAFRLRISETQLTQELTKLSYWLIQDDISVISDGYQVDAPERAGEETETETETETEGEGESRKKPRSSSTKITFSQWQDQLRISGDKAITDYRPVWEYAETVGLQADWIYIAWLKFKERYTEDTNNSGKRYIDWRRTFLNAVKDNWFKLWYLGDKGFTLTTTGSMADLETRA